MIFLSSPSGEYKLQLAQTQAEVESLAKEKSRLLTTVGDLQLETERLELDIAFLTEEKGKGIKYWHLGLVSSNPIRRGQVSSGGRMLDL